MSTAAGDVFSPRVRRLVLGVALASSVAVLTGLLYGARLVQPTATPRDSLGNGPLGHQAFLVVLERLGIQSYQSRGDRFAGPTAPLVFLDPTLEARVEGRERTLEEALEERRARNLPTVLVLPKWHLQIGLSADDPPARADGIDEVAAVAAAAFPGEDLSVERGVRDGASHTLHGTLGDFAAEIPDLQAFAAIPSAAEVLLEAPRGAVVLALGSLVVVSDPDLVHSFNLHRADHVRVWLALLERFGSDVVVVDEVFHGHGKVLRLGEALGQFPAVLVVAQLLLLAFLVLARGARRFGPPLRAAEVGRGPREAIAVSAHVLADGQPLSRLAQRYVAEAIADAHRRLGLPPATTAEERALRLDEVAERRGVGTAAVRLLGEAQRLDAKAPAGASWALVRAAHRFRHTLLTRPLSENASA
ncbi:MAG: hypothetical protein AAF447_06315 [Myxococcota bacterium]